MLVSFSVIAMNVEQANISMLHFWDDFTML